MSTSTLRLAQPDDARQITDIYAPLVRDTAVTFEVEVPSTDAVRARIVGTSLRFPWLVAERTGGVAGFAYAGRHRRRAAYAWSAEVSVYVAEYARGGGVGRGLYAALLALLTHQGYANALAGIALPNDPSIGLHRAAGFTPVGVYRSVAYKLGAWWDVQWWQRRLSAPVDTSATVDTAAPPTIVTASGASAPDPLPEVDTAVIDRALRVGERQIGR